jgi:hypothetical protein
VETGAGKPATNLMTTICQWLSKVQVLRYQAAKGCLCPAAGVSQPPAQNGFEKRRIYGTIQFL